MKIVANERLAVTRGLGEKAIEGATVTWDGEKVMSQRGNCYSG